MADPKIVLFDLETMPNLEKVLANFTKLSNYPGLTLKAQINSIICFGYSVFGERSYHVKNAWDFSSWKTNVNDDRLLCEFIFETLLDADCVVTHNGRRFDWKFLQTRLVTNGLKPLPKILHVDTCQVAKSNLMLLNNKLDTVAKELTSEQKLENGGWDLWVKVWNRDKKAMKLMSDYCKQDIVTLEAVFKRLKPFISNLPNYNLFSEGLKPVCPNCASTRLQSRGTYLTKVSTYRKFQCQDCGSWTRTDAADRTPRSL